MDDLTKLFQGIASLPPATFRPGASPSQRSSEFSLLDSVLPFPVPAGVVRTSKRNGGQVVMHYQIRNGVFHDIQLIHCQDTSETTMVVDGKKKNPPTSKKELALMLEQLIQREGT